jgi:hypothetical protein
VTTNQSKKIFIWIALLFSLSMHLLITYSLRFTDKRLPQQERMTQPLVVHLKALEPKASIAPENKTTVKPNAQKPELYKQQHRLANSSPSKKKEVVVNASIVNRQKHDVLVSQVPEADATDDIISRAKRDAGKIDRELRQERPMPPQGMVDSLPSKLQKGIAAAGKNNTMKMESITFANGKRITKVYTPAGTYCVVSNTVGSTGSIDAIQNGMQYKTITCPY